MKKSVYAAAVIILMLILNCCSADQTKTVRENAQPLSDGTKTYYVKILNEYAQIIKCSHYDENDKLLNEYEFEYTYDLNGKTIKRKKTNTLTGETTLTEYDKMKNITFETYYDRNSVIIRKNEFSQSGSVKRTFLYKNGEESGYIIYDYYSDGQIKNESEYSENGRSVRITTYYKNRQLYQIKEFGSDGMISKITKYSYKGDTVIKKSVYNSEFELTDTYDYTKDPAEHIAYKDGEPLNKP